MVATPVVTNVGLLWECVYSWSGSIKGVDLLMEWIYSGSGSIKGVDLFSEISDFRQVDLFWEWI